MERQTITDVFSDTVILPLIDDMIGDAPRELIRQATTITFFYSPYAINHEGTITMAYDIPSGQVIHRRKHVSGGTEDIAGHCFLDMQGRKREIAYVCLSSTKPECIYAFEDRCIESRSAPEAIRTAFQHSIDLARSGYEQGYPLVLIRDPSLPVEQVFRDMRLCACHIQQEYHLDMLYTQHISTSHCSTGPYTKHRVVIEHLLRSMSGFSLFDITTWDDGSYYVRSAITQDTVYYATKGGNS